MVEELWYGNRYPAGIYPNTEEKDPAGGCHCNGVCGRHPPVSVFLSWGSVAQKASYLIMLTRLCDDVINSLLVMTHSLLVMTHS